MYKQFRKFKIDLQQGEKIVQNFEKTAPFVNVQMLQHQYCNSISWKKKQKNKSRRLHTYM